MKESTDELALSQLDKHDEWQNDKINEFNEVTEAGRSVEGAVNKSPTSAFSRSGVIRTASLYVTFFAMGLSLCVLGTTLVSMERLLNTTSGEISWVHVISALGFTAGSILCAAVFDRVSGELQLAGSCLLAGLAGACAPFTGNLYGFISLCGIQSAAIAYINCGANPYAMRLWDKRRFKEPLMQGLHAIWSVATTIGPFIIRPFLTDFNTDSRVYDFENNSTTGENATSADRLVPRNSTDDLGSVVFAYVASNSLLIISGLPYACLFLTSIQSRSKPIELQSVGDRDNDNDKDNDKAKESEKTVARPMSRSIRVAFLGLLCSFIGIYFLIERCIYLYIAPFVVKGLGWRNRSGPFIFAALSGAVCGSRLINVGMSALLRPRTMLLVNMSLTALSFILMCFVQFSDVIMWVSTSLFGFGIASTFPTTVLWLGSYVKITGFVSGVMNAGGSVTTLIFPLIVGYLFGSGFPMAVIYFLLGSNVLQMLVFLGMHLLIVFWINREKETTRDEREIASFNLSK